MGVQGRLETTPSSQPVNFQPFHHLGFPYTPYLPPSPLFTPQVIHSIPFQVHLVDLPGAEERCVLVTAKFKVLASNFFFRLQEKNDLSVRINCVGRFSFLVMYFR